MKLMRFLWNTTKVISVAYKWLYIYYIYYISATWMRIEESPLLHEIAIPFTRICFTSHSNSMVQNRSHVLFCFWNLENNFVKTCRTILQLKLAYRSNLRCGCSPSRQNRSHSGAYFKTQQNKIEDYVFSLKYCKMCLKNFQAVTFL